MNLSEEQLKHYKSNPEALADLLEKLDLEIDDEEYESEDTEDDEPETPSQDNDYIKQLREENKKWRLKTRELEDNYKKITSESEAKKRQELEQKQEYEKLYNDLKGKLQDYDGLKSKLEEYAIRETKEKDTLLKKLPTQMRDVFADAKLEQVRAAVEMQKISMPASPGADGTGTMNGAMDVSKMSIDQLSNLAQTNYPAYEQLILGKK